MDSLATVQAEMVKVMLRANPPVVMTLEDVATVLGMSYNYVRSSVQHQPDFPAKLVRFKHPRWSREAILKWANVA